LAKNQNIDTKNQIFGVKKSKCGAKFKFHRKISD